MREIQLSADELIKSLLNLEKERNVCILDSCGVSNLGSHLLIAGFDPVEILEINETDADKTLRILDNKLSQPDLAAIFTISYDFGLKLNRIPSRPKEFTAFSEPDAFVALFDCLIIHDYNTHKTFLTGDKKRFDEIEKILLSSSGFQNLQNPQNSQGLPKSKISSNFTRASYLSTVEKIQEFIRRGDTYQTNLTQQMRASLPESLTPEQIFLNLRQNNPVPFASFLRRKADVVISASPERFFKTDNGQWTMDNKENGIADEIKKTGSEKSQDSEQSTINCPLSVVRCPLITVSPIKGTRPRGKNEIEDAQLRNELLTSEKDRAENVMIVDLLRNDIGRVCKFGSVEVAKLCDLETHPTLFHLVSTVEGELLENIKFSDIIRATFPCGSITGAPKIRTMQIINELETADRGLSMGAVGFRISDFGFRISDSRLTTYESRLKTQDSRLKTQDFLCDLSVAIRTIVIRDNEAIFNVGGGIVIDSIPEQEYEETLIKARALLNAINADVQTLDKE